MLEIIETRRHVKQLRFFLLSPLELEISVLVPFPVYFGHVFRPGGLNSSSQPPTLRLPVTI
jgi:hypothetical protein